MSFIILAIIEQDGSLTHYKVGTYTCDAVPQQDGGPYRVTLLSGPDRADPMNEPIAFLSGVRQVLNVSFMGRVSHEAHALYTAQPHGRVMSPFSTREASLRSKAPRATGDRDGEAPAVADIARGERQVILTKDLDDETLDAIANAEAPEEAKRLNHLMGDEGIEVRIMGHGDSDLGELTAGDLRDAVLDAVNGQGSPRKLKKIPDDDLQSLKEDEGEYYSPPVADNAPSCPTTDEEN